MSAPVVINATTGGTVSGVDIAVVTPASSTPPNAQVLGVGPVGTTVSLSNTGATISRGTTMKVALCGPGLSGSMQVNISGPQDFTISNIRSATCTSGSSSTPGIAFDLAVNSGATLGARTVVLQSSNNDITTFTGGLEFVP